VHTKRTKTAAPRLDEKPLALDGLHQVDGLCHVCKTPTMHLDHHVGKARCVVCGYTRKKPYPFAENYCETCEMPHWPNLVSDTAGTDIRALAQQVSAPRRAIPHADRMYKARFPGALSPVIQPMRRVTQLGIEELNDELDALLTLVEQAPCDIEPSNTTADDLP
jgi:hypothetical protein